MASKRRVPVTLIKGLALGGVGGYCLARFKLGVTLPPGDDTEEATALPASEVRAAPTPTRGNEIIGARVKWLSVVG